MGGAISTFFCILGIGCITTCPVGNSACEGTVWTCTNEPARRLEESSGRRQLPPEAPSCDSQRRFLFELKHALLSVEEKHQRRLTSEPELKLKCPDLDDSKFHHQLYTCEECCESGGDLRLRRHLENEREGDDDNNNNKKKEPSSIVVEEYPWMYPQVPSLSSMSSSSSSTTSSAKIELVQDNPGIWLIHNFFNASIVDELQEAVMLSGMEHFGRCAGQPHEHLDDKQCFQFGKATTTVVVKSSSATEEDEDDQQGADDDDVLLVEYVMKQLGTIWPSQQEQRDYMYAQLTKPGCGPTKIHRDVDHMSSTSASATVTAVIYLQDGGAGLYFPHAGEGGTVIQPQKGMVVTWINVKEDGSYNYKADHGIQATPIDYGTDRLALTFRVAFSAEERKTAKNQAEEMRRKLQEQGAQSLSEL